MERHHGWQGYNRYFVNEITYDVDILIVDVRWWGQNDYTNCTHLHMHIDKVDNILYQLV